MFIKSPHHNLPQDPIPRESPKERIRYGFFNDLLGVSINLAHIVGAKVLWERVGGKQEYAGIAIYSSDGKETTVKGNEHLAKMLQLTTVPEEGASEVSAPHPAP